MHDFDRSKKVPGQSACGIGLLRQQRRWTGLRFEEGLKDPPGLAPPKQAMHLVNRDTQIKIIRAPHANTATFANLAQIGGPS